MASSIGFRIFSFLPSCYSSYGAWTLTPVGLSPTVHASLRWTHTFHYQSSNVISNRLAIYCFVGLNLLRCELLCIPQSIGCLYIHIRFHTSPIRVRHRQDSSWGYLTGGRLR